MCIRKLFLALSVVCFMFGGVVCAEGSMKMYSLDSLNIRESPSGDVIGLYDKGEEVEILEYGDDWSKTTRGYVASAYLGETPDGSRDVGISGIVLASRGFDFKSKIREYKEEYKDSEYKFRDQGTFITVNSKKVRNAGSYYLTRIVLDSIENISGYYSYNTFGGECQKASDVCVDLEDCILAVNGGYFDEVSGSPKGIDINIYDGELITDGVTTGNEICLLSDGTITSFDEGLNGQDLLDKGVIFLWASDSPVLIDGGEVIRVEDYNYSYVYPRTAIGYRDKGEYYIITSSGKDNSNGLSLIDVQEIFSQLGCEYARVLDSGGSVSLVFDGMLLNETSSGKERKVSDFLIVRK